MPCIPTYPYTSSLMMATMGPLESFDMCALQLEMEGYHLTHASERTKQRTKVTALGSSHLQSLGVGRVGSGLSWVLTNRTSERGRASSTATSTSGLRTPVDEASPATAGNGDAPSRPRDLQESSVMGILAAPWNHLTGKVVLDTY